jgi:TrmH family RNA methyltransferase
MKAVLANHRAPADSGELSTLRRVDTLAEAISDCSWVVGTTMRTLEGRPRLTPRELAESGRHDQTWALVFGAECNGLQNEHVDQCHAVSFIPSSEEQPSLNLSQAVVVYAHELWATRSSQVAPSEQLADDASLREVRASIVAGLVAQRVLRGESASRGDVDALMSSLMRASLTAHEAELWNAVWRARAQTITGP